MLKILLNLVLNTVHPRASDSITICEHLAVRSMFSDEMPHPIRCSGFGVWVSWKFNTQRLFRCGMRLRSNWTSVFDIAIRSSARRSGLGIASDTSKESGTYNTTRCLIAEKPCQLAAMLYTAELVGSGPSAVGLADILKVKT
jgi:hypothetical protein